MSLKQKMLVGGSAVVGVSGAAFLFVGTSTMLWLSAFVLSSSLLHAASGPGSAEYEGATITAVVATIIFGFCLFIYADELAEGVFPKSATSAGGTMPSWARFLIAAVWLGAFAWRALRIRRARLTAV